MGEKWQEEERLKTMGSGRKDRGRAGKGREWSQAVSRDQSGLKQESNSKFQHSSVQHTIEQQEERRDAENNGHAESTAWMQQ